MQTVQTNNVALPPPWIQICIGNKRHVRSFPALLFLREPVLANDFKIFVITSPASCHRASGLSFDCFSDISTGVSYVQRHLYLDAPCPKPSLIWMSWVSHVQRYPMSFSLTTYSPSSSTCPVSVNGTAMPQDT